MTSADFVGLSLKDVIGTRNVSQQEHKEIARIYFHEKKPGLQKTI
jgi:hypothetical protein